MKHLMDSRSTLWAVCLLLAACGPRGGGAGTLSVEIDGAAGRMLYLENFSGRSSIRIDSVTLAADGTGRLSLRSLPMDFYRITLREGTDLVLALDSTSDVRVKAPADALYAATAVTGSAPAEQLFRFQKDAIALEEERERIRMRLQEQPGNMDLLNELNATNRRYLELCQQTVRNDPGAPVALSAVSRLDMNEEFELYKQVRDHLFAVMHRSGFYVRFKQQVDRAEQAEISRRLQEEELKRLSAVAPAGAPAPEIRQATPQGKELALSDLRGKVVLIDFWASWCRPCRVENPRLKEVYAKYKDQGFEILGVSLDRDHNAWVKAIQDDGLPWKHVSDLRYWQNAAALEYAVSSIPHGVLVDREGQIIARGVRAGQLDQLLAQALGR